MIAWQQIAAWSFLGVVLLLVVRFAALIDKVTDTQVRVWHATRYPKHWQSKTPWQTVIEEPTYDAAVKTAAERMNWPRDTFAVTPVTKEYVDQREIRYTP